MQLCCKSLLERDPAIEKSFRVLAITVTLGNYDSVLGHSGEYGNDAKLVGKISKSVMQLISIHF